MFILLNLNWFIFMLSYFSAQIYKTFRWGKGMNQLWITLISHKAFLFILISDSWLRLLDEQFIW